MNSVDEQFRLRNKQLVLDLAGELSSISSALKNKGSISIDSKKHAISLLEQYIEALNFLRTAKPVSLKRVNAKTICKYNEQQVVEELGNDKGSIELLVKLGREKMIHTEQYEFCKASKDLLQKGYIEEIVEVESESRYYILSSKGIRSLKSKNVAMRLKNKVSDFSVPDNSIFEFDEWTNIYGERIRLLQTYFKIMNCSDYFVFPIGDNRELVMASRIEDSISVEYFFPAVFSDSKEKDINCICAMAESGLVDSIVIICGTLAEKEELVNEGLVEKQNGHIKYYVLG